MTQLHSRCCLESAPPPFSADWSALISRSKGSFCGRVCRFGVGGGCGGDDRLHGNPDFSSRAHIQMSLRAVSKFHYCCSSSALLLRRGCGGLFSVLDYFSILQGLHGYDIKYSRDHRAKTARVGETPGRLLPKQTQLAERWRQLAD